MKPECFGHYSWSSPICTDVCKVSGECKVKSRVQSLNTQKKSDVVRRVTGWPPPDAKIVTPKKPVVMKPKAKLLEASFNTDIAIIWGIVHYRRMLDRTDPLMLVDELEWLLQGEDCIIRDMRLDVLKEEVERRTVWDSWKDFMEWATTIECDNCNKKNRIDLAQKIHRCGNCKADLFDKGEKYAESEEASDRKRSQGSI